MTAGPVLLGGRADARMVRRRIPQALERLAPQAVRFTSGSGRGGLDETSALFNRAADSGGARAYVELVADVPLGSR